MVIVGGAVGVEEGVRGSFEIEVLGLSIEVLVLLVEVLAK